MKGSRVAFTFPALWGGGVERVTINLARGLLDCGMSVDFVVGSACESDLIKAVPKGVRVVDLKVSPRFRLIRGLPKLFGYFWKNDIDVIVPYWTGLELLLICVMRMAYLGRRRPRVIYCIHNVSRWFEELPPTKRLLAKPMTWLMLRIADGVIAVSRGAAREFSQSFGFAENRIQVIYNPVVVPEIYEKASEPLDHPFFREGSAPVILGVGRLTKQKDFPTLIRAFALVRKQYPVQLIILGEGEERSELRGLTRELGLEPHVSMPGFVENPYQYMKRASVLVLSSAWEGLPGVLVEAMALGTPVVSTNCPSGPEEILEGGKYGPLVPVGDPQALAEAILHVLRNPPDPELLRNRAREFSIERATEAYIRVLFSEPGHRNHE